MSGSVASNLEDILKETVAAGSVVADMVSNAYDEASNVAPAEHIVDETHAVNPAPEKSGSGDIPAADSHAASAPAADSHAASAHDSSADAYMSQFQRVEEGIQFGTKFVAALHNAPDDEARVKALMTHCQHLQELLTETYKLIVHQHNFFSPE